MWEVLASPTYAIKLGKRKMRECVKKIFPSDEVFTYSGRIDFDKKDAPVFVYPCTSVRFAVKGKNVWVVMKNIRCYFENSIGVLVDGDYKGKCILPDEGSVEIDISGFLDGKEHEVTVFKRQDASHYVVFEGLITGKDTEISKSKVQFTRRIEVYGDSVSAGEVSEAVARAGLSDPENNGEYSNSFYSYSWLCARKLHADIHDVAQGGIALLHGQGYFAGPDYTGMEESYDKIEMNPYLGETKPWDFSRYTPHVVIVAFGQNDANPVNYMAEDYEGEQAEHWRTEYRKFIETIQKKYPKCEIILTTTILNHDAAWDRAIGQVAGEMKDKHVHHFLYTNNGSGTHGHIRIPEAEKMAEELSGFIESLGEEIWKD